MKKERIRTEKRKNKRKKKNNREEQEKKRTREKIRRTGSPKEQGEIHGTRCA